MTVLADHVAQGVAAGPGAVFVACGTGEFHALDQREHEAAVRAAVVATGGAVPVFAGAGGPIAVARAQARAARAAGADGLLLMPPYLVDCPPEGLVGYVTAVAAATDLPVIVYHRGNARFGPATAAQVAALPTVVGIKDGVGDLDLMTRIVSAVRPVAGADFQFFNGLPTAELTVPAYRAIGVQLYSSAVFAFAPEISLAFFAAVTSGDSGSGRPAARRLLRPARRAAQRGRGLRRGAGEERGTCRRAGRRGRAGAAGRPDARARRAVGRHRRGRSGDRRRIGRQPMTDDATITAVRLTPVAFADPPLLNAVGVHEPFALRTVIEVEVAGGHTGLGETYADATHLAELSHVAPSLVGLRVHATNEIRARIAIALRGDVRRDAHGLTGIATAIGTVDRVFAPFEVACLDVQGRLAGVPVSDLLGGAVRDRVPYSAYLFYKWAGHPGAEPDGWGAALDPAGIVAQARQMIDAYGFDAIKLKGGVFAPEDEIEAVRELRAAFPDHRCAWTPMRPGRSRRRCASATALDGVLEYLEDPTGGLDGMAEVARRVPMPLATNMCVVSFDHLPEGIAKRSVGIVLSDHHYWGGLHRSRLLAGMCDTFGLGLSMHSNSHLGISLAAMTHLAAATPNLTYACDTHWPWKRPDEDVITPGTFTFRDGTLPVPTGPGLGVDLDRDALARLHEQYLRCGLTVRDDTGYMQRIDPAYRALVPRW